MTPAEFDTRNKFDRWKAARPVTMEQEITPDFISTVPPHPLQRPRSHMDAPYPHWTDEYAPMPTPHQDRVLLARHRQMLRLTEPRSERVFRAAPDGTTDVEVAAA